MKIKKTFQGSIPVNKIMNARNTSKTDTYSCDYINNLNNYSTEEQIIGTWIDGKPVYRKCFSFGDTAPTTIGTTIDSLIKSEIYLLSSYMYRPIPFLFVEDNAIGINEWAGGYQINPTNGDITYFLGTELGTFTKGIAIFEYTKTTD